MSSFKAAHQSDPNDASLLYLWGVSLVRDNQAEASLPVLREAAHLAPAIAAPHLALGEAIDALGRRPEAEQAWRAALAINPDDQTALEHLSADLLKDKDYLGVVSLLGPPRPAPSLSLPQTLNLGEALVLLARPNEAIDLLKSGLKRFPDAASLADQLGTVQMLIGQQSAAYETLERTLSQHPRDRATQALYLRSLITGKSEKAKGWADRLIAERPNDAEILYLGADLAWKTGDSARAAELVNRSLTVDPTQYKAQLLLGTLLSQTGDLKRAEQHMQRAIDLGDPEPDVRYQLSRVQARLGELDASRQTMETYQAIRTSDKGRIDAAEEIARGDQAMHDGDPSSAAILFRKALQLQPHEALIHYKLSRALDQLHDLTAERNELQSAISIDPNFAEALNQLGFLNAHQGDPQGAEDFFLAAIKASPSYVVAWTNLAATYASESKWQQAGDAADHALAIDPGNSFAQRVKALIHTAQSTP